MLHLVEKYYYTFTKLLRYYYKKEFGLFQNLMQVNNINYII
jgi:hypothetical protein